MVAISGKDERRYAFIVLPVGRGAVIEQNRSDRAMSFASGEDQRCVVGGIDRIDRHAPLKQRDDRGKIAAPGGFDQRRAGLGLGARLAEGAGERPEGDKPGLEGTSPGCYEETLETITMILSPIAPPEFDVELSLAYAGPDNFTGKPIYARAAAYLHSAAIVALSRAIGLAGALGLKLKIFDAFRPTEAQWLMWNHTPDPEFLADPRRGSPHSRGVALDLTLIERSGRELDMGTAFDAFTPLSHHASCAVSPQAQRNRLLLLGLMTAAGWDFYRNEWWHYQLFDPRRFPLLSNSVLTPGLM